MKKMLSIPLFFFFSTVTYCAKIDTVLVQSKCMNKMIKNIVITPQSYSTQKEGFPVLYLLHGAWDNFSEYVRDMPIVADYADKYNMIIVCPDGGGTSWYFDSPVDSAMKYETYISRELVGWVDGHYKTIKDRKKRAISGLSMGGHGALYLAFRHQEIWGAAGSMAGGVDIRPFPLNWEMASRLGTYAAHPENWEKNTVINLVHLLDGKDLAIFFDCGVDDFFYDPNVRLHQKLLERKIPHTFIVRPGKHDLDYWRLTIRYQLFFFNEYFLSK